jgi:dihydroorotase
LLALAGCQKESYDIVLKGGHVIDTRNGIDKKGDVAIKGGKIARVADSIPVEQAGKVINVEGLYVTPGLIDIHAHVYSGTGQAGVLTGDQSVYPDGFTFRVGVTTVVDAGTAGWRNFEDFKDRVIDRSKTRVLVLLNIAGLGMSGANEQDQSDMEPGPLAEMAKKHSSIVVGVKSAHFGGPEWISVENAVKAGEMANIPVMVDFGANKPERPISELFMKKLRPGDIYTHVFSGLRHELGEDGKLNPALAEGRKRGIIFDIGHGGGSFRWNVAMAAFKEGFWPDTISTDLHTGSMNAGMKDQLNIMSKFLSNGVPLAEVIKMSADTPAKVIKRLELGHLGVGAGADVAVLRVDEGQFGFVDSRGARAVGNKLLVCEFTLRDGQVVWDLNGRANEQWEEHYKKNPDLL